MPEELTYQQIFKLGYDEVLAALKHQDEKINRTLTALAFLTAAGVALYTQLRPRFPWDPPVRFDDAGPEVPAVMFVIFLAAVTFALLGALAAVGPGRPLRFRSKPSDETKVSLIYHGAIANDTLWWTYRTLTEQDLERMLARHFHAETQLLAYRVEYKIARSRESVAFVQLAILALALLGIFQAGPLEVRARWWVAAALLFVVLLVPLWELHQIHKYDYDGPEEERDPNRRRPYYVLGLILIASGSMLLGAPETWTALGYALAALLISRLALVNVKAARPILGTTAVAGILLALITVP